MNWFKKKPEEIPIKYARIRKPKKGEKIIFLVPEGMGMQEIKRFKEMLDIAWKTEGPMIMPDSIKVKFIRKPTIKVKGGKYGNRTN